MRRRLSLIVLGNNGLRIILGSHSLRLKHEHVGIHHIRSHHIRSHHIGSHHVWRYHVWREHIRRHHWHLISLATHSWYWTSCLIQLLKNILSMLNTIFLFFHDFNDIWWILKLWRFWRYKRLEYTDIFFHVFDECSQAMRIVEYNWKCPFSFIHIQVVRSFF